MSGRGRGELGRGRGGIPVSVTSGVEKNSKKLIEASLSLLTLRTSGMTAYWVGVAFLDLAVLLVNIVPNFALSTSRSIAISRSSVAPRSSWERCSTPVRSALLTQRSPCLLVWDVTLRRNAPFSDPFFA